MLWAVSEVVRVPLLSKVNADETNNVIKRTILNWLNVVTHHEHDTLYRLDKQIILLSRNILVVGSLYADLATGMDSSKEDTTESVEVTLIRCENHI